MAYLGGGSLARGVTSGSITVPSGSTIVLVVVRQALGSATATATLGGAALTTRGSVNGWYYGAGYSTRLLYIVSPTSGAQTLSVSGASVNDVVWVAYDGISTATPFAGTDGTSSASEDGGTPSVTLSSSTSETALLVVGWLGGDGSPTGLAAGTGDTLRAQYVQFGEGAGFVDSPGAASVAVSATFTGTGTYRSWGALGTRLVHAAAGGVSVTPTTATFAFAGLAPTVTRTANLRVTPAAATAAFAGNAPMIGTANPQTVSPGVGTLSLTGFAPTVTRTLNVLIRPLVAALTFTGRAPAVTGSFAAVVATIHRWRSSRRLRHHRCDHQRDE